MAQESQNIESIFDFFYLDTRKINSFYAQLTGNGALTSRKSTNSKNDEQINEGSLSLPTVATLKTSVKNTAQIGYEDNFDASQTMPREIIDRLDELGFISYELNIEELGNLVLLKGSLGVVDVAGMKDIIDPALEFGIDQMPSQKPSEKTAKNQFKKLLAPAVAFMKAIPFSLQARFFNKGDTNQEVWMTLNRSEMFNSVHDLNFKHGDLMAGEWYVLGVLDAIPHDQDRKIPDSNEVNSLIEEFTKVMKEQFGRPSTAYGMTPIAIFRVLKPKT